MTTIFNQSNFTVKKIKEHSYTIEYMNEDSLFFSSLMFKKDIVETNVKDKTTQVMFNATSVQTLNQLVTKKEGYLSYDDVVNFIHDIGTQCVNQEKKGVIFSGINKDNIIVIDDTYFLLLDTDIYAKQDETTYIIHKIPYKDMNSSPEILSLAIIPGSMYRTTWMYSLASLCIELLLQQTEIHSKRETEIKTIIESIQDTKLYFCLLRMLLEDPVKRKFLFI